MFGQHGSKHNFCHHRFVTSRSQFRGANAFIARLVCPRSIPTISTSLCVQFLLYRLDAGAAHPRHAYRSIFGSRLRTANFVRNPVALCHHLDHASLISLPAPRKRLYELRRGSGKHNPACSGSPRSPRAVDTRETGLFVRTCPSAACS